MAGRVLPFIESQSVRTKTRCVACGLLGPALCRFEPPCAVGHLWNAEEVLHYALSLLLCTRKFSASQGKYDEADSLILRAIEIEESIFGPDHLQHALNLNIRAGILKSQVW